MCHGSRDARSIGSPSTFRVSLARLGMMTPNHPKATVPEMPHFGEQRWMSST
jgi:hypothetical protein